MFGMGWAPGKGAAQGNRERGSGKSTKAGKISPGSCFSFCGALKRVTQRKRGAKKKKVVLPSKVSSSLGAPGKGREQQPGALWADAEQLLRRTAG